MNILPKKSWHVRTKANIARVRRDEAKAAAEEKETQRRIALAAQEARTALLRERASKRLAETTVSAEEAGDVTADVQQGPAPRDEADLRFGIPLGSLKDVVQPDGHVNFFQDVEAGKRQGGTTNEEYEEEKKQEQEDYEKKIGYLVYLGQDSLEQSKQKPWYAKIDRGKPQELDKEVEKQRDLDNAAGVIGGLEEKSKTISMEELKMAKSKSLQDPLQDIRKYLSTPGLKKKLETTKTSKYSKEGPSDVKKPKYEEVKTDKRKKHKSKKSKKHKKKHKKRSRDSSSDYSSYSEDSEDEKKRKLENLRQQRLEREREERRRAEKVLAKRRGDVVPPEPKTSQDQSPPSMQSVKQKYNSQFNPHLARQNFE